MNLANALSMLLVFLIGFAAHRASLCIAVQWQARWFEELTGLQNTRLHQQQQPQQRLPGCAMVAHGSRAGETRCRAETGQS